MNTELYLDTARLGQMCRGARIAEQDFVKLVSRLRSSLYFGEFLTHGFNTLTACDRRRFSALGCWSGVAEFKREFGRFVSQPSCPTFLFSASQSLIHFAAECLFDSANMVLTTDLAWPPYLETLQKVAVKRNATLHVVRLRRIVFDGGANINTVVQAIVQAYHAHDCDGLFLSDITYLGVRIPVRQITDSLAPYRRPFVVVDGAQALAQHPVNIQASNCDLYLAGTQKWFSAYHPLRLAFVGRPHWLPAIHTVRGRLSRSPEFNDPLLDFSEAIERNECPTFGETVNLAPLITAAGALRSLTTNRRQIERLWETRRQNARIVMDSLPMSFLWGGQLHTDLVSGIVLVPFRAQMPSCVALASARRALKRYRIAATVLPNSGLRLAMPSFALSLRHVARINALVQRGCGWN